MSDYVDEMVEAFVEALLWAGLAIGHETDSDDHTPTFEEAGMGIRHLHEDTVLEIRHDCEAFYEAHACILDFIRNGRGITTAWYSAAQAGHDFYLTREGHGAGFWDRGLGVLGDILTRDCKPYGSVEAYVGDDGKIHL